MQENINNKSVFLSDETATLALGAALAKNIPNNFVLYLHGDLGAGKTTLVRGFLHALGYQGKVKSPTYTLIEPYQIKQQKIYHFDLYRLTDPEELDFIGIRDYFDHGICLIEWPENGKGYLPMADLHCYLSIKKSARMAKFQAETIKGNLRFTLEL
jgi:tRNA threonylcarbamoyladenosine biosynthesis protein TsaE